MKKQEGGMSRMLTFTILSISLLTVMAGAAVAPALGIIHQHFSEAPDMLIKFIVSMPALFIIIVNLLFTKVCRLLRTRTIALIGLLMYVVCGCGAFLVDNITTLLVLRALLGVSVGLIMPLSTGLLAYYFPPQEMARLMGLSAAMNQMGGVVATLLAGILATRGWNYAFLVYALGIIATLMVIIYLPNERLTPARGYRQEARQVEPSIDEKERKTLVREQGVWIMLRRFHPSIVGMLLCMMTFFVFVSNFAITESERFDTMAITWIMVGVDVIAFIAGMLFGLIMHAMPQQMKYMPPLAFMMGFALMALGGNTAAVIAGGALIGCANGIGVPYLNTIASIKGGKESVTTVMPLISAALYLGQFVSPIIVGSCSNLLFADNMRGPYIVAVIIAAIYMLQVTTTRHFQSLPPQN
ncbi:MAG: MFS transporter [Bacteroidaceae bacterium]|nr:MFS transporter [Bacteroidaceae bacterium]